MTDSHAGVAGGLENPRAFAHAQPALGRIKELTERDALALESARQHWALASHPRH